MLKKSRQKFNYLENEKSFFIIFEGLSLKQIKTFFLEGESPTLIGNLTRYVNWEIDDIYF